MNKEENFINTLFEKTEESEAIKPQTTEIIKMPINAFAFGTDLCRFDCNCLCSFHLDLASYYKVLCKDRYKIGLYVKMQYLSSTPLHSKKLNGKQSGNGLLNHIIGISPQPGTQPAP